MRTPHKKYSLKVCIVSVPTFHSTCLFSQQTKERLASIFYLPNSFVIKKYSILLCRFVTTT